MIVPGFSSKLVATRSVAESSSSAGEIKIEAPSAKNFSESAWAPSNSSTVLRNSASPAQAWSRNSLRCAGSVTSNAAKKTDFSREIWTLISIYSNASTGVCFCHKTPENARRRHPWLRGSSGNSMLHSYVSQQPGPGVGPLAIHHPLGDIQVLGHFLPG